MRTVNYTYFLCGNGKREAIDTFSSLEECIECAEFEPLYTEEMNGYHFEVWSTFKDFEGNTHRDELLKSIRRHDQYSGMLLNMLLVQQIAKSKLC